MKLHYKKIAIIFLIATFLVGAGGLSGVWAKATAQHPVAAEHALSHELGSEVSQAITPAQSSRATLPLWIVIIPVLGALGAILLGERDKPRNILTVSTSILTFILLIFMYGPVVNGINIGGQLYKGISYQIPFLPGFNLSFRVDPAGLLVAVITAFLWVLSSIYAISYMTIEEKHARYDFFSLATLAANMGVLLAGDFLTLFIFFEGLIIFPYVLIAHKETPECLRGANMYLYMGVVSSLCLLGGTILFYTHTGSVAIQPVAESVGLSLSSSVKYLITILMVIGFGGKAGLFFEHIWLPNAHPVAPTPASALLSGAMIKAGAYGIFRVVNMLFLPNYAGGLKYLKQWATMANIGYAIIWVGTVTMFLAVLSALITANSKRMLAFHSVSQMGYIVLGIGCAAYMGADGAMGLAGAMYHIVNHALFKCSLFLCVGAVYFRTHQLDMYKLGGLWRNMPVMAIGLFIAVCGISGIPGFNGFASKTLLHHAILEAYDHSAHLLGGVKDFKLKLVEIIFMLTAGGTFASNIKLFMLTFMGKRQEKHAQVKPAPLAMKISIGLVSFAILYIGLFPNWMLETFIGPALASFGFDAGSHAYHLLYNVHGAMPHSTIPILYPMTQAADQIGVVVHNLLGAGTAVMLGGMYFIPGMRFGLFHLEVPAKFQLEYYYRNIFRAFAWFCRHPAHAFGEIVDRIISWWSVNLWLPFTYPRSLISWLEKHFISVYLKVEEQWQPKAARFYVKFCGQAQEVDVAAIDGAVNGMAEGVGEVGRSSRRMQTGLLQNYALIMILGLVILIALTYYLK
jgi:formate hydrogenlyase subunit 3/multisubunit Na+/H+ antiporter MnhD subunit